MLLHEILSETFVSQSQRGKFYACASGKGYDCGDQSTGQWKRMTKEFEDSTPKGKKLPKHVHNNMKGENCMCNKCRNMAPNDVAEETWETGEVGRWIMNDEGAYQEARRIVRRSRNPARELEELWDMYKFDPELDISEVDWDAVAADLGDE